ncbi:hypothetical protein ACH473_18615 [Cellulosimicrobium funkei]|uniref:hypothetical protein n=1 Tax=Cellulosimicrobium funkei TaxID=264251 RepID=UPI0037AC0BD8
MKHSSFVRTLAVVGGLSAIGAVTCFALNELPLGLIATVVLIVMGFVVVILNQRRATNLLATQRRQLRARDSEAAHSARGLLETALKIESTLASTIAVIESGRSTGMRGLSRSAVELVTDGAMTPSSVQSRMEPHRALDHRLLTVGRPLGEESIAGVATQAVIPGSVPAGPAVDSGSTVIIDEIGFARGLWKTFEGGSDEYLLAELSRLFATVQKKGLHVITIRADRTPAAFTVTRAWGIVVDSVDEIDMSRLSGSARARFADGRG